MHVDESAKIYDAKFDRIVPSIPTYEELEMQEKEMDNGFIKMIETIEA